MAIQTVNVPTVTPAATFTSTNDSAVTFMSLCNHGLVDVVCSIHVVPSGDSPTTANLLISDLDIITKDTYIIYQGSEKLLLENGDRIMAVTDIATVTAITSYTAI